MSYYDQSQYDVRLEWGLPGVEQVGAHSDVTVIVDVLSFSTCVDIATSRGAAVYPYRWKDDSAEEFAKSKSAYLAGGRNNPTAQYSLSPESILKIPKGIRLVLPSPNGSALSLSSKSRFTLAGCLRNCRAVAERAIQLGKTIIVVPAGERWEDGSLRFALEDLIGAGAIISHLEKRHSPEAGTALACFNHHKDMLLKTLSNCISGRELIEKGFKTDVELASDCDCSATSPMLKDDCYVSS